jgi:transposase
VGRAAGKDGLAHPSAPGTLRSGRWHLLAAPSRHFSRGGTAARLGRARGEGQALSGRLGGSPGLELPLHPVVVADEGAAGEVWAAYPQLGRVPESEEVHVGLAPLRPGPAQAEVGGGVVDERVRLPEGVGIMERWQLRPTTGRRNDRRSWNGVLSRQGMARLGLSGLNRQRRTPVDRYIGMDAHSQTCTLRVLTAAGKEVGRQVVETNGSALVQVIRSIAGTKHLCLEEGTQSAWLYELLKNEVDELVVTMPGRRGEQKDDARDALQLAEGLRAGAIKQQVYKACGPYSELRAAMRSYGILRCDVARTKNRLKALYRSRGIATPGEDVYRPEKHHDWEKLLPAPQRQSAALLYSQIESLTELWAAAEQRLLAASKPHKIIRILSTAPAIGPIRAAQIVATVVTPHRFRTSRQFWAYCGLGIAMRSSSDWVRDRQGQWVRSNKYQTRGLNRNRQPMLKAVFKGAAQQVATRMTSHPLHADYQRLLDAGTKPNLAQLTIARRLAAAVLAMWKREEVYDPEKHRSHITIAQA